MLGRKAVDETESLDSGPGAPWGETVVATFAAYRAAGGERDELAGEVTALEAELHALEERAGDLGRAAPSSADEIAEQLARLRARLDVRRRMHQASARDVDAVRAPAVWRAQAVELEARAVELDREADRGDAEAAPLEEALRRIRGVNVGVLAVHSDTGAGSLTPRTTQQRQRGEAADMRLVAVVLEEVAAGGPVRSFEGPRQISPLFPVSLYGLASLVPAAPVPAAV
jgi:hypothetical protein